LPCFILFSLDRGVKLLPPDSFASLPSFIFNYPPLSFRRIFFPPVNPVNLSHQYFFDDGHLFLSCGRIAPSKGNPGERILVDFSPLSLDKPLRYFSPVLSFEYFQSRVLFHVSVQSGKWSREFFSTFLPNLKEFIPPPEEKLPPPSAGPPPLPQTTQMPLPYLVTTDDWSFWFFSRLFPVPNQATFSLSAPNPWKNLLLEIL